MSTHRILVIQGLPDRKTSGIFALLETMEGLSFDTVELADLFKSSILESQTYDAILFDCRFMDSFEIACVLKISMLLKEVPILLLAEQIALEAYRRVDRLQNTVALQKPFRREVFEALLRKTLAKDDFKPQVCPRFITDEEVRVLVVDSGLLITSRMRNYSAGGAFVEYRGISLGVGDRLQISVPSSVASAMREYLHLHARVVWLREGAEPTSPIRGIGVQFVEAEKAPLRRPAKEEAA